MSAFTDRLVSTSSKDVRLRVTIDGVPIGFEAVVIPPEPPRLNGSAMLVSVEESRTILDRQERRQVGGGATIVVQDRAGILRGLFAQRSFRTTYIKASVNETATTILVDDVTQLPASGHLYVAGESILYASKTAPSTLNGCVRGYLGSPKQRHQGDADTGAGVYLVPPSWLGRRVRLQGYCNNDDGVIDGTSQGMIETLATFRLEAAPQDLGEGRWELRCSHLSDELAKRKLGTGLSEIKPDFAGMSFLVPVISGGVEVLEFVAAPGTARMLTQGSAPTAVMMSATAGVPGVGGISVHAVHSLSPGSLFDTIRLVAAPLSGRGGIFAFLSVTKLLSQHFPVVVEWLKHVAILDGELPATTMRRALTSRLGNGINGTDDVLGGVLSTALGGVGFRFGAGILAAEIDLTSLVSTSVPPSWSWVVDEEVSVGDLLRDYCMQSNTAAVFNAAGQLRFTPLLEQRQAAVATINEADIKGKITAVVDEGAIFSRVRLLCNYDPIDGEYEGSIDIIDEEIALTYAPAEGSLEIESRAIVIAPVDESGNGTVVRNPMPVQELQSTLRRTMLDSRGGSLLLSFRASAKHIGLQLGDLVTLALPSVSDFRGGTLAGAKGRVIERQPDWQTLDVDLTVIVEEVLSHFAPGFAPTSSVDNGDGTWFVAYTSSDFGAALGASTSSGVRVGDRFRVYDPVNNVSVGLGVIVTSVLGGGGINVANIGGSFPLLGGWALLLMEATDAAAADGFTGRDYTYFGLNAYGITSRWR